MKISNKSIKKTSGMQALNDLSLFPAKQNSNLRGFISTEPNFFVVTSLSKHVNEQELRALETSSLCHAIEGVYILFTLLLARKTVLNL